MSVQQFKCIFIYFILKINMKRLEGYFRQKMKMKFLTVVFNSVGPTHTYTVGWWWSLDSLLTGSIELVCCNALWALHETVQTGRRWTSVSPDNRDWIQVSDAEVICGAIHQPNQLLHLDFLRVPVVKQEVIVSLFSIYLLSLWMTTMTPGLPLNIILHLNKMLLLHAALKVAPNLKH